MNGNEALATEILALLKSIDAELKKHTALLERLVKV